jgi:hypothetical protein
MHTLSKVILFIVHLGVIGLKNMSIRTGLSRDGRLQVNFHQLRPIRCFFCVALIGYQVSHNFVKVYMSGKCCFFGWLALHGRCSTSNRLCRDGLPDRDDCVLCAQEVETLDHLLIGCV